MIGVVLFAWLVVFVTHAVMVCVDVARASRARQL